MSLTVFDLELPELSKDQPPAFTSAAACQKWLTEIPFTNARQAQAQLLRQINLLNRFTLPAEERLNILELLRAPTYFVHGECSKRFISRPLPLAPPEQAALETCQVLWQALETGYLHCLRTFIDNKLADEASRRNVAIAATRALTSLLSMYLDDCQAGMLPARLFWRRLHRIYRGIEKIQLAQVSVEDPLRRQSATSPVAAYVEVILMASANPLELRPRQLSHVAYWAQRWSSKVPVLPAPPIDLRTPPLCVDLVGDEEAVFKHAPSSGDGLRWLDLADLRKTIKQRLAALAQGESPESLNLGKDCTQPGCEILLKQIYQDWCRGGRDTSIQGGNGACQLVNGIEAIHYFLSGEVFHEPKSSAYLSQREHNDIATLGHIGIRSSPEDDELARSYTIEDWHEINENVSDILLQRQLNQPGGRLTKGQLVAVRTSSNDSLQIGKVYWAAINANRDTLLAGIHPMPGPPVVATLHTPGMGTIKAQYCRGFSLPAIEGLKEPASVLTPAGWFQPNHIIEVKTDDTMKIRLTRVIDRGVDFERCTYEVCA
jgi:hypothetical protein